MAGEGMDESYSLISVDVKRVTDNHQDSKAPRREMLCSTATAFPWCLCVLVVSARRACFSL
jgi:hypothetical protein